MSARKVRLDPAQQKARKQKIIVIVGAVVLLALIAFEAPKVLHHKSGPSASPGTTTTTTTPDPNPVAPGAPAQPVSAAVPAPGSLPDARGASASDGQLVSFSLFQSKDPFRQQLTDSGAPPAAPPASTPPSSTPPVSTPPSSTPPVTTPPSSPPVTTPPASTPPTTTPAPPTAPAPPKPSAPTSASISVNGAAETVAVGASFPQAQPLFRLVSLKGGVAHIGVAGGTLQGSSQTVELVKGKSLTLMNTADGMRYVLRLVSVA